MDTSLDMALANFFGPMDAAAREKYKSGVLNFTSKLRELPQALEENNEQQISLLLHSVNPLSAYLNLISLNSFLKGIRESYGSDPGATKELLQSYISQIESYLDKL